jgi:hypothetical protein
MLTHLLKARLAQRDDEHTWYRPHFGAVLRWATLVGLVIVSGLLTGQKHLSLVVRTVALLACVGALRALGRRPSWTSPSGLTIAGAASWLAFMVNNPSPGLDGIAPGAIGGARA